MGPRGPRGCRGGGVGGGGGDLQLTSCLPSQPLSPLSFARLPSPISSLTCLYMRCHRTEVVLEWWLSGGWLVVVVVKVVISSSPRLSALAAPLSTLLSPLSFFFPSPISGRLLSAGLWSSTHASRRKEQKTLGFSNPCEHLAVSRAPFERFERHIPPRVRSPQGEWRHEVLATPLSHRVQGLATIMVRAELLCPALMTLDCSPSRHPPSHCSARHIPPVFEAHMASPAARSWRGFIRPMSTTPKP